MASGPERADRFKSDDCEQLPEGALWTNVAMAEELSEALERFPPASPSRYNRGHGQI